MSLAENNPAAVGQVNPTVNDQPRIVDLVIDDVHTYLPRGRGDLICVDLQDRASVGHKKYGTYLQAFNGRDALMDLYQELLDASKYLRQIMVERPQDIELLAHYKNILSLVYDIKKKMVG